MLDLIRKMTEDMRGKVQLMVGRALLMAVNDQGAIQTAQVQLLAEEVHDDAERIQEYGFTSVPKKGAEAVVTFVGGNRDHGLIIAVDDRRYRLKGLQSGEVAIYDDQGQKVHLTRAGIVVDGAGKQITFKNAPKARMEMDLEVTGDIKDKCDTSGKTMAGMRTIYNGHDHNDPQGGAVEPPNQQM
jgi:phage baseplate assembly protein V